MMKKTMALALCSLLAVGVLLPAAQAAHFTFYAAPFSMHREIASFELDTTDASNKNGPAVDDTRAVPADANIYPTFHGLSDILRKTTGDAAPAGEPGDAVADHFLYGSAVEAGAIVPYHYAVGQASGQGRTTPTSMHFYWFGWFEDRNGDGIIDDAWCSSTHLNCGAASGDEFIWRGGNTGETWNGLAFFFPGDYDGSLGTGNRQGLPVPASTGLQGEQLSALSGDCSKYNTGGNNPGCVTPSPDMPYADSTASAPNAGNQRWAGNNGGGQWTPEEFLLVNQHVISFMVGDSLLNPGSPETIDVACTASQACFRDYDWYQAVAGDTVSGLYLTAMRTEVPIHPDLPKAGVRSVWYWGENLDGVSPPNVNPCPVSVVPFLCAPDNRHTNAVTPAGATQAAFATQAFSNVVPAYTGTPALQHPAGFTPPQGFYGDYSAVTGVFTPESQSVTAGFVRPTMTSWVWNDDNGDGYIGRPDAEQVMLYQWGAASSPNDGACNVSSGGRCELTPTTAGYKNKVVKVTPGASWAPGTQWFTYYENGYWGVPCPVVETATSNAVVCHEEPSWHMGALTGTSAVFLRADPERCAASYFSCRTIDSILIPDGSPALDGVVLASVADTDPDGNVDVSWIEGTTTYTVSFSAAFSADTLDAGDVNAADYPAGAQAIAGAAAAWALSQV